MFAPRPRRSTEPQNDTAPNLDSISVVRCDTVGTDSREFLVYQILGPPELFNNFPSDDLTANEEPTVQLDEFNIRQRKPKAKSDEITSVSEEGQTPVRPNNPPDIVATYGTSTSNTDECGPCEGSSQINADEVQTQSLVEDQGTDEDTDEYTGVQEPETPVRVRKRRAKSMSGRSRTPGWHICTQCSYTTKKRSMLERHYEVHREKPRIKCNKCELNFANESALKKHQLSHNTPYQCSQCGDGFSNYQKLESHFMKEHTYAALYNCKECDYSCSKVENMRRHVRCHTGERPYQCPHCTYAGADSFKLKRHILTHLGQRPYRCDTCDASFTQINDLKTHKYKHSSVKPHACDICPKSFLKPQGLKKHRLRAHRLQGSNPVPQHINSKNLGPWICSECGMSLSDEHKYELHMEYHKELTERSRKSHKCDLCPNTYARISNLVCHKVFAHNQPNSHASPQLINSTNLETSQNLMSNTTIAPNPRNHRSKPVSLEEYGRRPHKCVKCPKAFTRLADLKRHEVLLHHPRQLLCNRCQKMLPDKYHYILHMGEHKKQPAIDRSSR